MTREDAINYLEGSWAIGEDDDSRHHNEVLEFIIKTLEQEPILDKIRADVIARYPKNYAREPELGGSACEFSLNQILQIIDKYKVKMEREE